MEAIIRPIEPKDNQAVAGVIRQVLSEYCIQGPGYAIADPELDEMHAAYQRPKAQYFVVERDGRVIGGAGISPLKGGRPEVCELQKMYFLAEARGSGLGQKMMDRCLAFARESGFQTCYLETILAMDKAITLYERNGFTRIYESLGATGHFNCDIWYQRPLA